MGSPEVGGEAAVQLHIMADELGKVLIFSGLSAWFSCSVNPTVVKLWGKLYNSIPQPVENCKMVCDQELRAVK